jgi:hypothetical protein
MRFSISKTPSPQPLHFPRKHPRKSIPNRFQ